MILLPEGVRTQLMREAEAAYPEECCGLLVGRRRADGSLALDRAVSSANVAAGRHSDRFEVDPRVRFRLTRELAGTASTLVGHYHSHPDHPAEPSATDRAMAFEPELAWLIITVRRRRPDERARAGAVRAFRINPSGAVFELPIVVLGEPTAE